MSTRLVHLVVDAHDTSRLAAFWAAALGWEVADDEDGEDGEAVVWPAGFNYPGIAALPLTFVPVPEPKTSKNRIHLDLASASAGDQADTVRRLRDLGATPADVGQGDVPWAVLADPEGNEFCVLDPRSTYRGTGPVAAVVIDCTDPAALARFWADAAGWRAHGSDQNLFSLRSASGAGPFVELLRVPGDVKSAKNRMHLDVAPFPGGNNRAEAARLRAAGATEIDVGQGKATWVVLTDPEGNEFCVLSPR